MADEPIEDRVLVLELAVRMLIGDLLDRRPDSASSNATRIDALAERADTPAFAAVLRSLAAALRGQTDPPRPTGSGGPPTGQQQL